IAEDCVSVGVGDLLDEGAS
nr:hypothetical protein [Tanacetum cinerariifolium]